METFAAPLLRRTLDAVLDAIPEHARRRVARYVWNHAFGEGIGDPQRNGEAWLISRAKRALRARPAVVFDVGANVGNWSLELARDMDHDLTIYAFEPSPTTFVRLQSAIVGASARVVPLQLALSDHAGTAKLYVAGAQAETNSLAFRPGVTDAGELNVELTRGVDVCSRFGIDAIDLLKVDVEGHELATLRGFDELLARQAIGCIQFEYGSTWVDARVFLADMFALLERHGYVVAKLMPHGLRELSTYTPELDNFRYANFLALTPAWRALLTRPRA